MNSTRMSVPATAVKPSPTAASFWRHALLLALVFGSLLLVFLLPPIRQDTAYHKFADARAWLGIPNFLDVLSNVAFLYVGLSGLASWYKRRLVGGNVPWVTFFVGIALVGFGSAYYHWAPRNDTLVWDRLPMTMGFMAMFVALLSESFGDRVWRVFLVPALVVGLATVLYWHWFDDLRFYAWVQFMPLLAVPVLIGLFRSRYSHRHWLLWALACYVLAKIVEIFDPQIFILTGGLVAGHAVKHLLAATGCFLILQMLRRRLQLESLSH